MPERRGCSFYKLSNFSFFRRWRPQTKPAQRPPLTMIPPVSNTNLAWQRTVDFLHQKIESKWTWKPYSVCALLKASLISLCFVMVGNGSWKLSKIKHGLSALDPNSKILRRYALVGFLLSASFVNVLSISIPSCSGQHGHHYRNSAIFSPNVSSGCRNKGDDCTTYNSHTNCSTNWNWANSIDNLDCGERRVWHQCSGGGLASGWSYFSLPVRRAAFCTVRPWCVFVSMMLCVSH